MNYKKSSVLLLIAALSAISYAVDLNHSVWECQHGKIDRPKPDIIQVEEDWNPKGNDHTGRTLQSYSNMRTYGYYGALGSGDFETYIQNDLIPPILDYYSAAIKIKYPVTGPLQVSTSTVCGVATPNVLRTGVNADFVYIVTTAYSSNFAASSGACSLASGTNRPIVGHTTISSYYLSATNDVLLHERNMICIMHEVIHTLGWTNGFYENWLDYQTGLPIENPTITVNFDGNEAIVVQAEPIRSMVRQYFGCNNTPGAFMENNGGSGTYGCHFERRHFTYEMMTSGLIYQMQFSQFTLGMLETMGWYAPDYSYADPFFFGQGQGCGFLQDTCSVANNYFDDLCDSNSRGCTTVGRGGANCQGDVSSDNCQFWWPEPNYDCDNTDAESYARLPQLQAFGRGQDSKCFLGTLSSGGAASETSFCFKYNCTGSGSNTTLTLTVGGQQINCAQAGAVTVSGYGGSITCPDPNTFCSTVGQQICPRNCMGRGTCVEGACVCNSGYTGEDCALNA